MKNLTFIVEEDIDGGFNAKAINESIFTQADTLEQLNLNIAEAIKCHFDTAPLPTSTIEFVSNN
jgi:predicted RNase H-like HicB family nuclease